MKFNKYRNVKTKFDGFTFDSKKEAARYQQLKIMQAQNMISDLKLQPKFKFEINGKPLKCDEKGAKQITYTADFEYIKDGKLIIEDVKSSITAKDKTFRIKKALFETIYERKLFIT